MNGIRLLRSVRKRALRVQARQLSFQIRLAEANRHISVLPEKKLFVEDDGQQGLFDFDFAVVFDEAEFSEFVHEKVYARTSGADHFGEGLLGDSRKSAVCLLLLAVASKQEKRSGEAFFAGVEELIDQIFFDANVVGEHIGDKTVG